MTPYGFVDKLFLSLLVVALTFCGRPARSASPGPIDADVVLVGGTILDGSGSPGTLGDVAIEGDRIVAVGQFETGRVGRTISCAGLIVTPGFIDLHNHSDLPITIEDPQTGESKQSRPILEDATRSAACYLTQGCTTVVTGNCGGGAVDVDSYYTKLETNHPGVNVAQLLPHGTLRAKVIGQSRRRPTEKELSRMRELARGAMEAGAWGMSTGLQYVPGSFADVEELGAIAQVVGEWDGFYASHIRDEGDRLIESIEEAIEIGRRGDLPVHISHFKASKRRNWGKVRAGAALIEKVRAEGRRVTADQYPYDASSTSITAMLLPDKEREGGSKALIKRLNDPEQLPRLRAIVEQSLEARGRIMIARCPKHPAWVGKMIREVAAAEQRAPVDVSLDILRTGNEQGVSFSMDDRDVRYVMTLPWAATASDGGTKIDDGTRPHPRSYGTFPRRIGRFAIEESVVPVELAVRSATGLPADILGLGDRGYLRPGYVADIAVIDPQTFRDHATFQSPFEFSTGMRWVLVNGQVAIDDGNLAVTGAGRPLRKVHTSGDQ